MAKISIDGELFRSNRRGLLRLAAGLAATTTLATPVMWPARAQIERSIGFAGLMARANALGIQVNPGQGEPVVGTKSLKAPLSPLVDIVNQALDLSLTGNTEAALLAQDAGELLSQINRIIRQPAAAEEIKRVYKLQELKADYRTKFYGCEIASAHATQVQAWVNRLSSSSYRERYDTLSSATGVPWYIIAVIHYRECSANFMSHLHNGDPLKAQTVDVPKNRPDPPWPPIPWNPSGAWQTSAIDALKIDNCYEQKDWTLERSLFRLEGFNGFGTRSHGVIPNYLWNFSAYPTRGGYDSDGHYKPDYISAQCGVAVILKVWANKGFISFPASA